MLPLQAASRASVLGAGGAARAVADRARRDSGAARRRSARARGRRRRAKSRRSPTARPAHWPPPAGSWDLLVNTTPVGTRRSRRARCAGAPLDGELVYDLRLRPGRDAAAAPTRARAGCTTIGGLEMLVAQAERSSRSGPGSGRPPGCSRRAAVAATAGSARDRQDIMKQTTFEEFVELARRGTFVPVVKEIIADLLTPVSAFLKIAEHSDYAFLFESVEGGEQRRALLVPRQGSVPRPARARRQDDHRRAGVTQRDRRAVRRRAAPADGGVPVAVRARTCRASPAAPSASSATTPSPWFEPALDGRRGSDALVGVGDRRKTRRGSCCSTRCWRSITSSTAS